MRDSVIGNKRFACRFLVQSVEAALIIVDRRDPSESNFSNWASNTFGSKVKSSFTVAEEADVLAFDVDSSKGGASDWLDESVFLAFAFRSRFPEEESKEDAEAASIISFESMVEKA